MKNRGTEEYYVASCIIGQAKYSEEEDAENSRYKYCSWECL